MIDTVMHRSRASRIMLPCTVSVHHDAPFFVHHEHPTRCTVAVHPKCTPVGATREYPREYPLPACTDVQAGRNPRVALRAWSPRPHRTRTQPPTARADIGVSA